MADPLTPDDLQLGGALKRFTAGLPPILPSLAKPQTPPSSPVSLATPAAALPPVTSLAPSPEQQRVSDIRTKLEKDQSTPSFTERLWNKTKGAQGVLGKIGHVGAGLLRGVDIAGGTLMPGLATSIPGSEMNRQATISQDQQELASAEKESQAAAEAEKDRASAYATLNPPPPKSKFEPVAGARTKEGAPVVLQTEGPGAGTASALEGFEVKPDKPTTVPTKVIQRDMGPKKGGLHNILVHGETGEDIRDMGPTRQPGGGQDHGALVVFPNGQITRATPGMVLPAGTQTVSGWAEAGRPTTQLRQAGARAAIVHSRVPAVLAALDNAADQLGPAAGRWNEFMTFKVGAPNSQMADLRGQLLALSSAIALAHAYGRLPENLREEFDAALNSPKLDAENLKATIKAIDPWMEDMIKIGTGPGQVPFEQQLQQPKEQQERPVYVDGKLTGYTIDGKTYSRRVE
jgi:hypothetical protein